MSQTGIGTTTPNASAKLDVFSTNKGFLPPRVALTGVYDVSTIPSPATGLLVYCTGTSGLASGYYFFNGTAWATIATEGGSGSVAAEFGAQFLSSNVSITSGTPVDVISFTLPSAGTWEVITFLRAQGTAGYASEFAIYDASNNLVPNSEILPAFGEMASTGTGVVRITTNGSAVYKVRAWASNGAFNVTSDYNGRTGVTWKKISGNAPVTGQSVDYIQASLSANQALSAAGNINFITSSGAGITITSGGFNLIANKTYKLEAAIGGISGGYAYYAWVDNSNNLLSGGSIGAVMKAGTAYYDAPQDKAVVYFTPTVDTRVFLRVYNLSGTLTAYAPSLSTNYSSTWASIQQVGSSAIINPWTLSGTNTFNTTGNVGIGNNSPTYTLDVTGTSRITNTPSITTATTVLVKDPITSQISEQPISYITGIAKFINNTTQSTIAANTIVKLNTTTLNTISSYTSFNTSGIITLQPGTYELNGSPGAGTAANGGGDSRCYPLFHNGTNYIGTGGVVESGPAGNYNTMPQNNANCVITVPAGQTATISLRLVVVNNMGSISSTGDYGDVADAGRAWVVVRKYN